VLVGVEQRAFEGVAVHQLLRLGRERLGLRRELGGLGLGEQRANPREDLLVHSGRRRGGTTRGGAGRRQDLGQLRQRHELGQQGDRRREGLLDGQLVAPRPLLQVRAVGRPPDGGIELLDLRGPAFVDHLRGVLRGVGRDRVHEQARDRRVGAPARDLPEIDGEPAALPHEPERPEEHQARGRADRVRVAREVASGQLGRAGRCLVGVAGARGVQQRAAEQFDGRDRAGMVAARAARTVRAGAEVGPRRVGPTLLPGALLRRTLLPVPLAHVCSPSPVGAAESRGRVRQVRTGSPRSRA
jgi:hypothetical protein